MRGKDSIENKGYVESKSLKSYYEISQDFDDDTLVFESRFESGNLSLAYLVCIIDI